MKFYEIGQRFTFLTLGLALLLVIGGCSSGGNGDGSTLPSTAQTGTVSGQVASAVNGSPVAGATVHTTAGTATTAKIGRAHV